MIILDFPGASDKQRFSPDTSLVPNGWILWREHGAIEPERPLVDGDWTTALISGEKNSSCIFQVDYHPEKEEIFQKTKKRKISPFMKPSPVTLVLNI